MITYNLSPANYQIILHMIEDIWSDEGSYNNPSFTIELLAEGIVRFY